MSLFITRPTNCFTIYRHNVKGLSIIARANSAFFILNLSVVFPTLGATLFFSQINYFAAGLIVSARWKRNKFAKHIAAPVHNHI